MAPRQQGQTAMDERQVEDLALQKALEDREKAKASAANARKALELKDTIAKGKIEDLDLSDGDVVRVGRFRIEKTAVESRAVSFETEPTSRLSIAPDKPPA